MPLATRWLGRSAFSAARPPSLRVGFSKPPRVKISSRSSWQASIGPTQLRPEYWSGFCGISNLQDPAENIYCGAQVLSHLKDRCGDEGCALEAYNVGIYGRREHAARRYIAKIDRYREKLRNLPL